MNLPVIFLVVALGLASAQASLLEDAGPMLEQVEKLPVLLQSARSELPLRIVLGHPEAKELDDVERQIRLKFGQQIREFLEKVLKKLQELGHTAEQAYEKLLEIFQKPANAGNAATFLSEITDLDDEEEYLKNLLDEILIADNVKEMIVAPKSRFISKWWSSIKNIASSAGNWISGKYSEFKSWAESVFNKVVDAASPIFNQIKALALTFLSSNWEKMSVTVVQQALNFFHPYAGMLGGMLVEKFIALAKYHGLIPWEQTYLLL